MAAVQVVGSAAVASRDPKVQMASIVVLAVLAGLIILRNALRG